MPEIELIFFQEYAGAITFLDEFKKQPQKLQESILAKLKRVREEGYRVRMPTVEHLEDGLYELRVKSERNNYRILFFFYNQRAILLPDIHHKDQRKLPRRIIEKALKQKAKFETDPRSHSASPHFSPPPHHPCRFVMEEVGWGFWAFGCSGILPIWFAGDFNSAVTRLLRTQSAKSGQTPSLVGVIFCRVEAMAGAPAEALGAPSAA